jgi:short coiled-coil protein
VGNSIKSYARIKCYIAVILQKRDETDLFNSICGPIFPEKMQEIVIATRQDDSAFYRVCIDKVCAFSSEGSARFECQDGFCHDQVLPNATRQRYALCCTATTMSFPTLNFEETPAIWGQDTPQTADIVRDALQKEAVIKYYVLHLLMDSTHPWFREILAYQEDLRSACRKIRASPFLVTFFGISALLSRVQGVQKEVDKLTSSNETLQMYINNLTVQMAKRR